MNIRAFFKAAALCAASFAIPFQAFAGKHGSAPIHPTYKGRLMAGYQGWFRTPGDGSGRGWVHWGAGEFDDNNCTVEALPEMGEYKNKYASGFRHSDGSPVEVFSSYDSQTADIHFKWMKKYGIDGAMVQRFFGTTLSSGGDMHMFNDGIKVLENAQKASDKHGRALTVMYDLSGAPDNDDVSERLINDWKYLVDELKITRGKNTNYLFHNGGPLVAIWGLGFTDRPYTAKSLGIEKFINFLKEDKEYGGCAIMLGVPTYFRTLDKDTLPDPSLHELIRKCDIVSPWFVGRFAMDGTEDGKNAMAARLKEHVEKDIEFCKSAGVDYAPVIYPGFSWHNLMRKRDPNVVFNSIPRLKGEFYKAMAETVMDGGAEMLYAAMFDEVDEATAIFKLTDKLPPTENSKFITCDGMGSDHYLKLSGGFAKRLKRNIQK